MSDADETGGHSRKGKQLSLFLRKFFLSQCCTFLLNPLCKLIYSEMLAWKMAICRFIGVFFPSKDINKRPNKMARFPSCLREDISCETHQSGPEISRTWMTLCLHMHIRKFQGTLFHYSQYFGNEIWKNSQPLKIVVKTVEISVCLEWIKWLSRKQFWPLSNLRNF